jgi:hypothetical protein
LGDDAINRAATITLSVVLAALASGCASQGLVLPVETSKVGSRFEQPGCREIQSDIVDAVARSEVGDAQARRIAGLPYMRVDRFLAHLGRKFRKRQSDKGFGAWVTRLRRLDDQAVRIEIANLPPSELRQLGVGLFGRGTSRERIAAAYSACAKAFVARLLGNPVQRQQLVSAAKVSDDYSDIAQAVGLFPLTSIPVAIGWENWKKKHLPTFQRPVSALPVRGRIVEWAQPSSKIVLTSRKVRSIVDRSRDRALGIPEPKGRDLKQLLEAFAPIWQIDVTGDYDQSGHPGWVDNGKSIGLDRRRPVVFTRISHAVVDGQILLQLNYAIWFQARPREGPLDLLGGHLDGVIWRVTLARNGRPLIYDSIHACGCYHLLFPLKPNMSARARAQAQSKLERTASDFEWYASAAGWATCPAAPGNSNPLSARRRRRRSRVGCAGAKAISNDR